MKLFFHAKSCISGFYHYLARNATEGSGERSLVVRGKFVLKNRVVTETYQEDGNITSQVSYEYFTTEKKITKVKKLL